MDRRPSSELNRGAWRALAWAGVLVMAVALVVVWIAQQWNGARTIGLFLVVSVAFLLMKDRLPSVFGFLVVLASLANAGGWALGWFHMFVWFDEFVHAFTAFAGVSALGYLHGRNDPAAGRPGSSRLVWWCAGAGLLLGLAWEVVEAAFLDLRPVDTVVDVVLDTLGAALGGLLARWALQRQPTPGLREG